MQKLPPAFNKADFTIEIWEKLGEAKAAIAEMRGIATSIPNQRVLLDTLVLQEAKGSSEIENIITTMEEIYRPAKEQSPEAKEVHRYVEAMETGMSLIQTGFISVNTMVKIQQVLRATTDGIRRIPGTVLKNDRTGEVVHRPPQAYDEIMEWLDNLEGYLNGTVAHEVDPLIKMAISHYQFEAIHPFHDGNGRTGRIINLLYLMKENIIDLPILYMSRYVNRNRPSYYELLSKVDRQAAWQEWIPFMLDAARYSALESTQTIKAISEAMAGVKQTIRQAMPKDYSQDLVNHLFLWPYTTQSSLAREFEIDRRTAERVLQDLHKQELVQIKWVGNRKYYINRTLLSLLDQAH